MNPLDFPPINAYVNDFSSVLSSADRVALNELFAEHERNTTEQVVVVLFPHRDSNELIDIGMKLFNENRIGQKGKNNGLLLIIATEEKKIRLITGKGMEIQYSEMRCRDIIENHLRPILNNGNYVELIRNFSKEVRKKTDGSQNGGILSPRNDDTGAAIFASVFFGGTTTLISLGLVDGMISGIIGTILSVIIILIGRSIIKSGSVRIGKIFSFFGYVLFIIATVAIFRPAVCTVFEESYLGGTTYRCERNVFGLKYSYTHSSGGHQSSNRDDGYSSSYSNDSTSSSWDSGGSSFGGGGGSSNGGGYGD